MTAHRLVVALAWLPLVVALALPAISIWRSGRQPRPDPVDEHAATVPTDDEDTVPIPLPEPDEIADLEAAWALPAYQPEDHR